MNTEINDWAPETTSLLERLAAAGFAFVHSDNGEDRLVSTEIKVLVEHLTATDESTLRVTREGQPFNLYLVYGNSPGELVCDYSFLPGTEAALDDLTSAHYEEWSAKPQPRKPSPYVNRR